MLKFYVESRYVDLSSLAERRALMRRARAYWFGRDMAKKLRQLNRALRTMLITVTPYAAAKKVGIALSTIYRAQKRIKEKRK